MPQVSIGEAISEVSIRLGDPNMTFFQHDEIYLYLLEGLRVFNALTGFWKEEFAFTVTPPFTGNWFAANGAGSPRQQTLTDTDVYNLIEYHLIEPVTGENWTGTNQ